MKKHIVFLIILLILLFCSCEMKIAEEKTTDEALENAEKNSTETFEDVVICGGWTDSQTEELDEKLFEVFYQANEKSETKFVPIKILQTQVVSGMNYRFLARREADGELVAVTVYHDLKGVSTIIEVNEYN